MVAIRRWHRSPTLIGVWTVSLLTALPVMGSSAADATLTETARSAVVLASLQQSNPADRVKTRIAPDVAPSVRMVSLKNPDLAANASDMPGAVMLLHDPLSDTASPAQEYPAEVDLSRLQAQWLSEFAPHASLRPVPRRPRSDTARVSTSGALAAPMVLHPDAPAPQRSLTPVARPEGLSRRAIQYSRDWLRRVTLRAPSRDENCLATAIYHEARGETLRGQFAVAEVILNRVASRKFPNTICGVVFQGVRVGRLGGCQFSFACDRKANDLRRRGSADIARRIAQVMADGGHRGLTSGALFFHTTAVNPSWSRRLTQTTRIGAHLFYRG